ncbi:MAG: diadenylate cyclase CdaA [Ruminococcus sp.]|nr:diadenylate cyclase CdaA [Ruminococcus sp.]MBP8592927.1 diadenylate cyclase CdaA [Ruminococcus sp.]MBQ3855194.1 diadenylate cyclase CdaA [Ruminococcus sp.]HBB20684.1 TIGR00159 family protein [Ruminococcus sp.]HOO06198.1 diadenylate cyclase CdaA [Ruminococcus sp.]
MPSLHDIKYAFFSLISTLEFRDIIDVAVLAYIMYLLLKLIRETRAGQLVKGILLLIAGYFLSSLLKLKIMKYILAQALDIGLIAMLILFQPELRRALEKFGRTKLGLNLLGFGQSAGELSQKWDGAIEAICDSCVELSASATGALIVVERQVRLGEQIETGTILNATPSKEVFGNIFYPKTPLHDGAVIMRDGVILAAACFLPKPQNDAIINKKLGSRHRAAIGMSENSDAVVIVVSEETGQISVAMNGVLTRDYTRDKLEDLLRKEIFATAAADNSTDDKKGLSSVFKRRKKK